MNIGLDKIYKKLLYSPKYCSGEIFVNKKGHKYLQLPPSKEEIKICKENSTILAKDLYMSLDTDFTERNLNSFVLGCPGSGKTRFYVEPNILQANTSFIINDAYGLLLGKYGNYLLSKGYKVKYLNLAANNKSMKYNPLVYIHSHEDIENISKCIVKNSPSSGQDHFWIKTEELLLNIAISYILETKSKSECIFQSVIDFIKLFDCAKENPYEKVDSLLSDLYKLDPFSYAWDKYKILKMNSPKTLSIVLVDLARKIEFLSTEEILNLTNEDDMELDNLNKEKTALFIIPSIYNESHKILSSMIISQAINTVTIPIITNIKNGQPVLPHSIHTRFILEDFTSIGYIPNMVNIIPYMSRCNVSVNILTQCLSHIKRTYNNVINDKEEWITIIDNCDTLIFTGSNNMSDIDYIKRFLLGKRTVGKLIENKLFGSKSIDMTNLDLNTNRFIIIRGFKPFIVKLYNLEKHPNYNDFSNCNSTFPLK